LIEEHYKRVLILIRQKEDEGKVRVPKLTNRLVSKVGTRRKHL